MKIGLVVHRYPPEGRAGTELHAALTKRSLEALGHEVAVLSGQPGDARRVHDSGHVRRLETPLTPEYTLALPDPWVRAEFERWLDQASPDVVHVHHLLFLSPDLVETAAERGLPVVVTLHDHWFRCGRIHAHAHHPERAWGLACFLHSELRPERVLGLVRPRRARVRLAAHLERPGRLRAQLAAASVVLAPSRYLRDAYEAFGIDGIEVLPHPISVARRASVEPRSPVRFGYLGALVPHKGIDVFMAATRATGVEPVLVGPAPKGAPKRGRWLGEIDHAEIASALAEVDVLVVPSLVPETFSLAAHEAQALGIPVIASRIGALPELVEDGINGLLVPPGDAGALARALERLSSPDEVVRLQSGARFAAGPSEHARALERVYGTLVGRSAAAFAGAY